jgi:hypothetical protein
MSSKRTVIAVAITTVALTMGSVGISQASSKTKGVSTKITRDADHTARDADRVALEALISKTIGVDSATVRTRLAAGESLGAIAGAKKAELIAVLVAEKTKHIDAAVTAGKLTAAQATTLKAGLTAHVTAKVDQVGGKRGPGMGGPGKGGKGDKGGRGHHGPGMDGKAKAPKSPATAGSPA